VEESESVGWRKDSQEEENRRAEVHGEEKGARYNWLSGSAFKATSSTIALPGPERPPSRKQQRSSAQRESKEAPFHGTERERRDLSTLSHNAGVHKADPAAAGPTPPW
jgi:hypothetical protein